MTPLIFDTYLREGVEFTSDAAARDLARQVSERLRSLLGEEKAARAMFMGRIGEGSPPLARSLRLPLSRLLAKPA